MPITDNASAAQEFLTKQVELLTERDTAGLSLRYAEDAMFVRFDRTARGRAEIKELFDAYLRQEPDVQGIDALQISDNVILYQAAERLDGTVVTAVGTLVFRDGLVWRQTVAFAPRPAG
jgi:hypothetical protein